MDSTDDAVTLLAYDSEPVIALRDGEAPTWLDYDAVRADLADDGVSAPEPFVEGMQSVVAEAAELGVDLKVVFTEAYTPVHTDPRDVAILLNQEYEGTVLVRTPFLIGSSSDTLARHTLEAGQDDAIEEVDPVASAAVFAHKIAAPTPPWGALSAVALVLAVVVAIVFAVLVRRRLR